MTPPAWLATESIDLAIYVAVAFGIVGSFLGWWLLPRTD
jgi:hypothetical protein